MGGGAEGELGLLFSRRVVFDLLFRFHVFESRFVCISLHTYLV